MMKSLCVIWGCMVSTGVSASSVKVVAVSSSNSDAGMACGFDSCLSLAESLAADVLSLLRGLPLRLGSAGLASGSVIGASASALVFSVATAASLRGLPRRLGFVSTVGSATLFSALYMIYLKSS